MTKKGGKKRTNTTPTDDSNVRTLQEQVMGSARDSSKKQKHTKNTDSGPCASSAESSALVSSAITDTNTAVLRFPALRSVEKNRKRLTAYYYVLSINAQMLYNMHYGCVG